MSLDATAPPTPLGIPKFNTALDAPSGKGSNAQMDAIDAIETATRAIANSKATLALVVALGS